MQGKIKHWGHFLRKEFLDYLQNMAPENTGVIFLESDLCFGPSFGTLT